MILIGQIADMFDQSTWTWIGIVCVVSPVIGFLVGSLRQGHRVRRRVEGLAAYYFVLLATWGAVWLLREEVPPVAIAALLMVLCGPVVGVALMFAPQK